MGGDEIRGKTHSGKGLAIDPLISALRAAKRLCKNSIRRIQKAGLIFLTRFEAPQKVSVNRESNKILFVGHSYHSKTKSTGFLLDYLREAFEVEVCWDEGWQGGPSIDIERIDRSYLAVVFFQTIPPAERLLRCPNPNILLLPMYDGTIRDFFHWYPYRRYKIVNFSRELHETFLAWGLNSLYLQYFPAPQPFTPGSPDSVFFWQRSTNINIHLIAKLLSGSPVHVHLHRAVDPGHQYSAPSPEEESALSITYSSWFPHREDLWAVMADCGVYIAPRELEGIGLSFLEAMAQGKAVVAVDQPTMNEYIQHRQTGYLFDPNNPLPLDFRNLAEVQRATHRLVVIGHQKWLASREQLLSLIRNPLVPRRSAC